MLPFVELLLSLKEIKKPMIVSITLNTAFPLKKGAVIETDRVKCQIDQNGCVSTCVEFL